MMYIIPVLVLDLGGGMGGTSLVGLAGPRDLGCEDDLYETSTERKHQYIYQCP